MRTATATRYAIGGMLPRLRSAVPICLAAMEDDQRPVRTSWRLRNMTFVALLLGCAVACAGQSMAEQDPSELPVALERIKERLNRPVALQLPMEREPDFRATVIEAFTLPETVLEALRRDLAGDLTPKRIPSGTITPPLVSVDLLQVATQMKRRVGGVLRARA